MCNTSLFCDLTPEHNLSDLPATKFEIDGKVSDLTLQICNLDKKCIPKKTHLTFLRLIIDKLKKELFSWYVFGIS